MKTLKHDSNGFSAVEFLLVIVVLAVIGFVGYFVANHVNKKTATLATTTSKTALNPYTGWKSYCDHSTKGCFKYPSNWTLDSGNSTPTMTDLTIVSPSNTESVEYISPYGNSETTDPGSFYTASLATLPVTKSLTIVGGFFTDNNTPSFAVVDTGLLTTYPLTIGQVSSFDWTDTGFNNINSGVQSYFTASDMALNSTNEPTLAKAWYSTADATTALLILKSLYYQ
jgi:hypothetical protein